MIWFWWAGNWGTFIKRSLSWHRHYERFSVTWEVFTLGTRHMVGFTMVRGVLFFCKVGGQLWKERWPWTAGGTGGTRGHPQAIMQIRVRTRVRWGSEHRGPYRCAYRPLPRLRRAALWRGSVLPTYPGSSYFSALHLRGRSPSLKRELSKSFKILNRVPG